MITTPTKPASVAAPEEATDEDERRRERNEAAIALLDSWINVTDEEAAEQRETWEILSTALDEDRLSDRKLFP